MRGRWIQILSRTLNWVAVGSLVAMMCLTCADIILRFFRRPILGTYEVVGFLGAMVAGFALAMTTIERGHVAVEVVVSRLPPRVQKIIFLITHVLSLLLFSLCTWECVRYGTDLHASGEVSPTLELPFYHIFRYLFFS